MQHTEWQDMIPFYVAGTLSPQEKQQFEQYVAQCGNTCQQEIEEWQIIGQAVRAQANVWSRGLPPISPRIRRELVHPVPTENHEAPPTLVHDELPTVIAFDPQASYTPNTTAKKRRVRFPLTLAASFITVFFFIAMLILLTRQPGGDTEQDTGSQGVAGNITETPLPSPWTTNTLAPTELGIITVPTDQPTTTPEPTNTPFPTAQMPTPIPTVPPAVLGGMGGGGTEEAWSMIIPSESSTPTPPGDICSVSVPDGSIVSAYQLPGRQYAITNTLDSGTYFRVLTQNGNGWFEVMATSGGIAGWVAASDVNFHPGCDSLPAPTATKSANEDPSVCTLTTHPETNQINLYVNPDYNSSILTTITDDQYAIALGVTEDNWYRVRYSLGVSVWVGWINSTEVITNGACDVLPTLSMPNIISPTQTPMTPPTATLFAAEPATVAPGGVFILRWSVPEVEQLGIRTTNTSGPVLLDQSNLVPAGTPSRFANSGQLQITGPEDYTDSSILFALITVNGEETIIIDTLSVTVNQ